MWALLIRGLSKSAASLLVAGAMKNQVNIELNKISESGVSFKYKGKNISVQGVIRIQFKALPIEIALTAKKNVGREQNISLSLIRLAGRQWLGFHIVHNKNRVV